MTRGSRRAPRIVHTAGSGQGDVLGSFGNEFQRRVILGVEIEAYSISTGDNKIGRRLSRPRPGLSESGERFTRDASIGSEYNSRPFATIREGQFLLKAGLRKYLRTLYRTRRTRAGERVPMLVGGWTNRFAGTHIHVSIADKVLDKPLAAKLAAHLHDQIPLLVAIGANSPVWNRLITAIASNRMERGSEAYFEPTRRGTLTSVATRELVFSPGRKTKPPTLELRVLDSNLPDLVVACGAIVKAVTLRWLRRKAAPNRLRHDDYLQARSDAGHRGMRARLPWKGEWVTVPRYLDRFLWEHRDELHEMDLPEDTFQVLRLLKRGYNGGRIVREAALRARAEHPQTWQRRFAKRYAKGLELLLSGNTVVDFAQALEVELPDTDGVWLGRRRASLDE